MLEKVYFSLFWNNHNIDDLCLDKTYNSKYI